MRGIDVIKPVVQQGAQERVECGVTAPKDDRGSHVRGYAEAVHIVFLRGTNLVAHGKRDSKRVALGRKWKAGIKQASGQQMLPIRWCGNH